MPSAEKKRAIDIHHFSGMAKRFCNIQDRSITEIKDKLKSWGCKPDWIEKIVKELLNDKYIHEQRFASNFARGKFRIKQWGRLKIMAALYQHRISQMAIKNAMNEIDEADYRKTLTGILEKKWKLTNGDHRTRISKTASYAIGKGFESTLVFEVLKTINK